MWCSLVEVQSSCLLHNPACINSSAQAHSFCWFSLSMSFQSAHPMVVENQNVHYVQHSQQFHSSHHEAYNPVKPLHRQKQRRQRISESQCPPHVLAMKLSNKGAGYLEEGNIDRAISYLAKALKLTEKSTQGSGSADPNSMEWSSNSHASCCICSCPHCQLESCMARQDLEPMGSFIGVREDEDDDEKYRCSTWQGGYLYSQPLRVSPIAIQEQHTMGVTLSLIVLFNLALSYQLSAVDPCSDATMERRQQLLKKSRQLYELCYQLQLDEHPQSALRFTMCIANNLSEIHRLEGNFQKCVVCLQHLLSTMMYMVDCQLPVANAATNGTEDFSRSQRASNLWLAEEMDGFFRNASKIILRDVTAGAA